MICFTSGRNKRSTVLNNYITEQLSETEPGQTNQGTILPRKFSYSLSKKTVSHPQTSILLVITTISMVSEKKFSLLSKHKHDILDYKYNYKVIIDSWENVPQLSYARVCSLR